MLLLLHYWHLADFKLLNRDVSAQSSLTNKTTLVASCDAVGGRFSLFSSSGAVFTLKC